MPNTVQVEICLRFDDDGPSQGEIGTLMTTTTKFFAFTGRTCVQGWLPVDRLHGLLLEKMVAEGCRSVIVRTPNAQDLTPQNSVTLVAFETSVADALAAGGDFCIAYENGG